MNRLTTLAVSLILTASTGLAAVPQLITFQGILKDGSGNPVTNGNHSVIFKVYGADAGGAAIWAETTSVATTNGLFTILLGAVHALPDALFNDTNRYLAIQVASDPEMAPRQKLTTSGYSFRSGEWVTVGDDIHRLNGRVGLGLGAPSTETKLHVRHFDVDNFGVLVDAHGQSGTEIGLHSGFAGYSSLAKNAYFNAGNWHRFNTLSGAFVQQVEPNGNVVLNTAVSGSNPIAWNAAVTLDATNRFVGVNRSTRVSSSEFFGIQAPVGNGAYGGMYIRTDSSRGQPFYGYATGGGSPQSAWTYLDGLGSWHLNNGGNRVTVSNSGSVYVDYRLGIGGGSGVIGYRLDVFESGAAVARFNRGTDDGTILQFSQGGLPVGTISVAGSTVSYNAFTGSHYGRATDEFVRGELVTLTGVNRFSHDNPEAEVIYGIKRSSTPNDPACLGSYLGIQESGQAAGDDNPHLVMAVGNGDMWVAESDEDIQAGDYLISSGIPGHAMKDDERMYSVGHIVARAAEAVDWGSVTETVDGHKHRKISVLFGNFVRSSPSTATKTLEDLQKLILLQQRDIAELRKLVLKEGSSVMAKAEP